MRNDATAPKTMSPKEFASLSEFIHSRCGIRMPLVKKVMLEARLQKRLRCLELGSYTEYCDYLFKGAGRESEYIHLIDCVTTNKTDFFREPVHFHFLVTKLLPEFLQDGNGANGRTFTVWSAACSTGEEPYTLAMVLDYFATKCPGFLYSITASDISTKVLDKARTAIYDESQVACVPPPLKQRYLFRSKDRNKELVRIVPALRARVQFQRINLMDECLLPPESLDALFCRNAIIYFDRETQYRLLARLCRCIKKGGYLFLGHSETVHGFELPLARVSSTIYQKLSETC